MKTKHTHEEFGDLKALYSKLSEEIIRIHELMRDNLIHRNGGSPIVKLYGVAKSVDVTNCDLQELYAADFSIKSIKGV